MSSRGSEKVCLFRCVGCGAAFTDFHDGEDHFALRGPDHKYEVADFIPASLLSEIAGEIQLALSEHGTYQDLIERLEAIVRDHSTPEEEK